MPYPIDALLGRSILIVEDEYFLADYIESAIRSAGGDVQGPFASVEEGVAWLREPHGPVDGATLNVNLADGSSYPLADELMRVGVPFLFASALTDTLLPHRFSNVPLLMKPFTANQVVAAVMDLVSGRMRANDTRPVSPAPNR